MKKLLFFLLFSLFTFHFSLVVFAGGPWFVDSVKNSGTAARWPYIQSAKKWRLRWKADPGPLTNGISSDQAVAQWIQPMLSDWQNVKLPYAKDKEPVQTVDLEIIFEGQVSQDITIANYHPYALNPDPLKPPPTVAIFDPDGSIIEDYCLQTGGSAEECQASRNQIVGMGRPFLDSSSTKIIHGFIFLNGRLINGISTADDAEMDPNGFKAVIKHEFGHLLNLDHAQVNAEMAEACSGDMCEGKQAIVTMYPMLKTAEQYSLHRDDKVAISWLYPSQNFIEKFCVIVGEIQDENGKGMQGVNVIAKNVNDSIVDGRSMISGVLYAYGTDNGQYILSGIIPGETYEVGYEALLKQYNEQSGSQFSPLGSESPSDFEPGVIAASNDEATVKCDQGGQVIEMQALKLSLSLGKAVSGAASVGEDKTTSEKKGWCTLNPKEPLTREDFWTIGIFMGLMAILISVKLKVKSDSLK